MNARGTRRPHPRRVRSKPVRTSRRGSDPKTGCAVLVFALTAAPTTLGFGLWLVTR